MFRNSNRKQWSWALYDWANSAFATTVMAGFFPVFFKQYWAASMSVTDSTFWLGLGNSVAALVVVMLAPLLGTLADQGNMKKRLLLLFAGLGIVMTGGLFLVAQGGWMLALMLYLLAVLGFSSSLIPYDSMLLDIARRTQLESVSSLGFALGYLGGGLLFAINVWMVSQPAVFGLDSAAEAVRYSFLCVALWWALFSLPVLVFVPNVKAAPNADALRVKGTRWRDLVETFSRLRKLPMAFNFLLAYWFYIDGVDTIVRMAVDYGLSIGFATNSLLTALLITQFVGFPAALVFGRLGERMGAKQGIALALSVYIVVVFWAAQMSSSWEFYALAVVIGLVQGGIQALSRALFARLIPPDQSGRFFGLYNMMGKFAAVLGPLLVGLVAALSESPRLGILSVLLLFLIGGWFLSRVRVERGEADVLTRQAWESPG